MKTVSKISLAKTFRTKTFRTKTFRTKTFRTKFFLGSLAFVIAVVASNNETRAQFLSATVRVDGLTCSLCHLSVHKAIRKLDFVEQAAPNIDDVSLDLTFKKGAKISFDKLAQAIEGAGFSIGSLKAKFYFQNVAVSDDFHLSYGGAMCHFVNTTDRMLNGTTELTVIDKSFVSKEDFEKWSASVKHECYKTGVAGECCDGEKHGEKNNAAKSEAKTMKQQQSQRVYHVTL